MGRNTAEKLNLLRVGPPAANESVHVLNKDIDITPVAQKATQKQSCIPPSTQRVIDRHTELFKGIGKLKDFQLTLHIDESVPPVQQPIRRIPFHTRKKVDEEIERLLENDCIEPVTGPTKWLNPIVVVPKKDDKV